VLPANAGPGDIGYQGPHFSGTGTAVTGAKPESKLWWNDGSWWSVMWDEVESDNFIYKLDDASQTWVKTGVVVDNRSGTRADVLWDGTKLFVASHPYANHAQKSALGARLYRYSYDLTTDRYTLDSGYPVTINGWRTETIAIAKDSTGRLWATWNQGTDIMVNRTLTSTASWGTPFVLPVTGATGITTDDISSMIAFGGNSVGIMWSDQTRQEFGFAVHRDGTGVTTWTKETPLTGPLAGDDHINLKADAGGRVYAAVKTNKTAPTDPLIYLLVRPPAGGTWAKHVYGFFGDRHTRPIVVLDQTHNVLHMFATSTETGGTIYRKSVEADNIAFEPGKGTPFIQDAASADVNDATSTKQNITAASGLVVQASNDTTGYYWHNKLAVAPLPLEANFVGTPTSGGVPLTVAFTDLASGDPTSWSWDFGDGTTSTLENPTKTYTAPGLYSVTLRVADAVGGSSEKTLSNYISVQPLDASFSGTPTLGAAPLAVAFTDTSTGDPVSWSWDFGDGTTSTAQNPNKTYAAPGTYTVRLTVTGKGGATNTLTRTDYVTALPLTAEFTGTPLTGPAPLAVTFTDASYGVPTSWEWTFGDGGTSTAKNPTHTYAAAGKYSVTLTVRDATGATSTKTRTEYVDALPLTADFTATPTFGAVPLAVTFSDTSIGTPTTWAWDFGDGTTSSVAAPSHTYTEPGSYTVTLTVADAIGATSTKTKANLLTVSPDAVFVPAADSFVDSSQASRNFGSAASLRVRNGATSPPHYVSYLRFEVGVGAKVTTAKVRLHVTDAALDGGTIYLVDNAWTETGITYANAPVVGGTALGTIPAAAAGTSVEVDLPRSVFSAGSGAYSFAIKSNTNGGAVWYSSREGVAAAQLVLRVTPLPLNADFGATPTAGGAPLTVNFLDASDGEPITWSWDFGDGTTSTEQSPTHTYTQVGTYNVTLTITDAKGGTSTRTLLNFVTVEALDAEFRGTPSSGAAPLEVAFADMSLGDPTAWSWDFGDGTTSTFANPTHTYSTAGTYTVTLTVTDAHGATNTETRANYVTALPLTADFGASPTFGTAPLAVTFTDMSIGAPTAWSWSFGDGGTSAERNPTYTYVAPGVYTVTLTITDGTGGTSTKTRTNLVTATGDQVFGPAADAYIDSSQVTRNFGTAGSVRVRNGDTSPPHYVSYIKFAVSGVTTPVTSATLRLHVTDASNDGGALYAAETAWTEEGLTWSNAPAVTGSPLASLGLVNLGSWVEIELPVSMFSAGDGTYGFAIKSSNPSGGAAWYSSREGVQPPQLILR